MPNIWDRLAAGGSHRFQPSPAALAASTDFEPRIQKRLAFLVGLVAICLPVALFLGGRIDGGCFRDSLSHFYYDRYFGPVFVGMLVFISGFLVAYTGDHPLEDLSSTIAGAMAAFVAFFPTTGPGCEKDAGVFSRVFATYDPETGTIAGADYFQLVPGVEHVHAIAAGALFAYLAAYCLVVLRRVVPERHLRDGKMILTKRRRNILYALCGIAILACIAVLGLKEWAFDATAWNNANLTFVVETIALWAFGLAWLAKGRTFKWLNDA